MIYGERIRQAREGRGFTQKTLADAIGLDQSAIARMEAGEFQPSDLILAAIAVQTGVLPSFFQQSPGPHFPLGSLLFRAHASLPMKQRQLAYRRGQMAFEAAARLAQRMRRPAVVIPRLAGTDPAAAARLTRNALALAPDAPIPNVIHAVEAAGVLIIALPQALDGVDAFSAWVGDDEKTPVILLPVGRSGARIRLSVAHDLGHLVLHQPPHKPAGELEDEAFLFASELLMPADAMHHEIVRPVTLTTLARLSPRWGVSIQALVRRTLTLNLVTQRQYYYLCEQIGAHGWRTDEPVFVTMEKPRAVRKMAEIRYGNPIDVERMAADLHMTTKAAREFIEAHATASTPPPTSTARRKIIPWRPTIRGITTTPSES